MGKGIDAARALAPEHAAALDDLKDQLLIVFLKRLGGKVSIPVRDVDNTENDLFAMMVEIDKLDPKRGVFHFSIEKKA